MPHTARQMFDLIADVAAYPEFLPWCAAARVRGVKPLTGGAGSVVDADLVISFKLFREKFGSRVTLHPEALRVEVEYLDGPLRKYHFKLIATADQKSPSVRASPGRLSILGDLRLGDWRPGDFRPSDLRPSDLRPSDWRLSVRIRQTK